MALNFTAGPVNCGSGASLDNVNIGTVMSVIYPKVLANGARLLFKTNGAGTLHTMFQSAASGRLNYNIQGASSFTRETGVGSLFANVWQTIAFTFTAGVSGEWYLCRTGQPLTVAASSGSAGSTPGDDSAGDFCIGSQNDGSQPFQGLIGIIAMWNRVLTYHEILTMQPLIEWLAGVSPAPPILPAVCSGNILLLPLGNGVTQQIDYSAYRNHGTVSGATVAAPLPVRVPPPWLSGLTVAV